jgi:hypothetical protein
MVPWTVKTADTFSTVGIVIPSDCDSNNNVPDLDTTERLSILTENF